MARAAGDSRRSVLPSIAGALRRSLLASPGSSRFGPEAHWSIRSCRRSSFHQPLVLSAGAGRYSSRSQPVFGCGPESRGSGGGLSTSGRAEGGPRLVKRVRPVPARSEQLGRSRIPEVAGRKGGDFPAKCHRDRATTRSSHSSAAQLARRRVGSRESQRTCPADHSPGLFLVKSVGSVGRHDPARRLWQADRSGRGGPRRTKPQSDRRQRP